MKKKILALVFISVFIAGCGSSSSTSETEAPPPNTAPVTGGSGTYRSDISGGGGYVNVEYIIKDSSTIDFNSFFITHYIDGQAYEHYFPSAFSNGSITRVESKVYIPSNDTGKTVEQKIEVAYYDDNIRVVNTFIYTQEFQPEAPAQNVDANTTL